MVLNLGIGESCAYQRRAEWIGTPVCNVRMKTATKLISEATSVSGQSAELAQARDVVRILRFGGAKTGGGPVRSTEESAPPIGEAKPGECECEDAERRDRKERRPTIRSIQFAGQEGRRPLPNNLGVLANEHVHDHHAAKRP